MAVPSPRRLDLEPYDIQIPAASSPDEAPALSSSRALARFEFEPGKGNEGTKFLMVECPILAVQTTCGIGSYQLSYQLQFMLPGARFAGHKNPCFSVCSCAHISSFFFVVYSCRYILSPYFLNLKPNDKQDYDFNQASVLKSTRR
jgi:hypothetical protein